MEKKNLDVVFSELESGKSLNQIIDLREYIPILEKSLITRKYVLKKTLMDTEVFDAVTLAVELEVMFAFEVLLQYTNIEITENEKTFSIYDKLSNIGLFQLVEEKCHRDYIKIKELATRSLGINDTMAFANILKNYDSTNLENGLKELKEVLSNKEMIKEINKLLAFNDPSMKEVMDIVINKEN